MTAEVEKSLQRDKDLLLQILQTPVLMTELEPSDWNQVFFEAHLLKLRGRLAYDAKRCGVWQDIPAKAQQILTNSEVDMAARQRKIMWEVNRVRRALLGFEGKVILVKGAVYVARGLMCAQGRHSVDVDILVAKNNLDTVENYLFRGGYGSRVLNEYDQQYYREWGHELPPLVHPERMVEVDVHHTILQVTNKLSPKIDVMIEAAECLEENIYALCDADMLLHSIVHQFVDGTLKASLKNLLEQHDLIAEFSKSPDFWQKFMERAELLKLERPVFYSLHYCKYFLNSDIPDDVMSWARQYAPPKLILCLMDLMVGRVMVPYGQGGLKITDYLATNGLYIRSHWLRMPLMMLVQHLTRKFFRRLGLSKN